MAFQYDAFGSADRCLLCTYPFQGMLAGVALMALPVLQAGCVSQYTHSGSFWKEYPIMIAQRFVCDTLCPPVACCCALKLSNPDQEGLTL